MRQFGHSAQTRPFDVRGAHLSGTWHSAVNTALVVAAFVFIGAVTLGLFP